MDLYDEDIEINKRLKLLCYIDIQSAESVEQGKKELENILEALHYRMELTDGDPDAEIEAIFRREFANIELYEGVEYSKAYQSFNKCKLLLNLLFGIYCANQNTTLYIPIEELFEDEMENINIEDPPSVE